MPKPHLHQHIYPPSTDQLKTTLLAALMMQRLGPTGPIAKQQQHHHLNVSSIDAGAPPRIPPLPPFFSLDSFPCADAATDGLPPRKAPRRSQSDVPFPPYPINPSIPQTGRGAGEKRHGGEPGDDLFAAFMNFDGLGAGDDRREGLDSGANSSENEAESSVSGTSVQLRLISNAPTEKKEGAKRSAAGDPASFSGSLRHCRSVSMDSFVGHLQFSDESPKLPPSPGMRPRQHSRSNSMAGAADVFSLEFRNGEFTAAELKKIMANDKLQEIARTDPKRVKRILANRQSAARSKERKMHYISELEHKVQKLQSEATTLSAQLTSLQRDSAGLTSQNNELKFRLQAMEQQAQLRDALNEALSAEVQRLKLITAELGDQASLSKNLNQKVQINSRSFQSQQQQSTKMTLSTATTAAE